SFKIFPADWTDCLLCRLSGSVPDCDLQPHGTITQFHFVNLKKNWTEAQRYCREKFIDLANIQSQASNTEARQVATGYQYVWIGLYNGAWKWSQEGTKVESFVLYQAAGNWGSKGCAALRVDGRWKDEGCETQRRFICYSKSVCIIC
uniref:C-type lectin domain-containing protein n=1 Tax=Stegastes partitus TaxID=144197 RepID=A0A3B5A941_9TELE